MLWISATYECIHDEPGVFCIVKRILFLFVEWYVGFVRRNIVWFSIIESEAAVDWRMGNWPIKIKDLEYVIPPTVLPAIHLIRAFSLHSRQEGCSPGSLSWKFWLPEIVEVNLFASASPIALHARMNGYFWQSTISDLPEEMRLS